MTSIQRYLNTNYPTEERHEVRHLFISNVNRGVLKLSDFVNVEKIGIANSTFEGIEIKDLSRLKKVLIRGVNSTNIIVRKCSELRSFDFLNGSFSSLRISRCANFGRLRLLESSGDILRIRNCSGSTATVFDNSTVADAQIGFFSYQTYVQQPPRGWYNIRRH